MEEDRHSVLVCFGERKRIVHLVTPSLASLKTSAVRTFSDVLPPGGERTGLLFQIQDDNWGGLFIDIEESQLIPDKSVIKMTLDSLEVVPSGHGESSVDRSSYDTSQVNIFI